MLALPHQHHNMAPAPLPPAKGMHRTVRGAALAVVGNSWTITNTAPLPSFEAATPNPNPNPYTPTPTPTLTLTLTFEP